MNVKQGYNSWSTTYDAVENPTRDLDHIATQKTLGDLRFKSILEIGCGTGKNTPLLAQIGERVQALDFSEGMVSKAKEKVRAKNVSFSMTDLTQRWQIADGTIDLVVCNLVLEHIENLNFIFAEAARVLVKQGRFFVCELHPFKQYQGLKANFQSGDEAIEIQAFVHHISDFVAAAKVNGLIVEDLKEWWRDDDKQKPPQLVSFVFRRID